MSSMDEKIKALQSPAKSDFLEKQSFSTYVERFNAFRDNVGQKVSDVEESVKTLHKAAIHQFSQDIQKAKEDTVAWVEESNNRRDDMICADIDRLNESSASTETLIAQTAETLKQELRAAVVELMKTQSSRATPPQSIPPSRLSANDQIRVDSIEPILQRVTTTEAGFRGLAAIVYRNDHSIRALDSRYNNLSTAQLAQHIIHVLKPYPMKMQEELATVRRQIEWIRHAQASTLAMVTQIVHDSTGTSRGFTTNGGATNSYVNETKLKSALQTVSADFDNLRGDVKEEKVRIQNQMDKIQKVVDQHVPEVRGLKSWTREADAVLKQHGIQVQKTNSRGTSHTSFSASPRRDPPITESVASPLLLAHSDADELSATQVDEDALTNQRPDVLNAGYNENDLSAHADALLAAFTNREYPRQGTRAATPVTPRGGGSTLKRKRNSDDAEATFQVQQRLRDWSPE